MRQLVQVRFDTGPQLYTYGWEFDMFEEPEQGNVFPLKVGERVVTPANWRVDTEQEATVVELGSDWPGPVRYIVRRVDHGPSAQ